ncbi:MAG: hypothetical protein CVV23_15580 [Ignavibacteriae bacterium HGW-Ignavibacteriae-2]|jgi:hypothetical protein|nr:MAG: hypothetical protein CVV23_15580 [Ignavibacteriae bacterium HGW-Ignavibacteriae-2]
MKEFIIKICPFLMLMLIWACNDPAPVQLLYDDSNDYNIELIPEPDVYVTSSTYDSTGIVDQTQKYSTVILINGIKTTYGRLTSQQFYAAALFSDNNQPVTNSEGKFLGYKLKIMGKVSFGNLEARIVSRNISFMSMGQMRDTLLGQYYELKNGMGQGHMHQLQFPYNSSINFKLDPITKLPITFNIPTPSEITGNIKISGTVKENNISIAVEWNSENDNMITLILGAQKNINDITPLIRVTVKDNGKFIFPKELLKNIPFHRLASLAIILERQKTLLIENTELSDNLIQSKSIHNIRFNVP